ncbi:hypothetical protein [Amycolatopsis kentuckyensis]|uniref:hypothetical protein n=1 Tax=Amycolatopsis kentuckyensis TaxID=218823 RepID=UPI000A3882B2|nr:hypothetical protein [Amycolatopsis kentuckyensis]
MIEDLGLSVAAHKYAADLATERYAAVRAKADQKMNRGDRLYVYAPDGETKLGALTKSAPRKTAQVHDEGALLEWVREHYPKSVQDEAEITGPDDEVKAFLWENGGRHLLTERKVVTPSLIKAILKNSNAAKAPVGPGGEADIPGVRLAEAAPSKISFLPDDDAQDIVIELIRSGAVKLPDPFQEFTESTADGA